MPPDSSRRKSYKNRRLVFAQVLFWQMSALINLPCTYIYSVDRARRGKSDIEFSACYHMNTCWNIPDQLKQNVNAALNTYLYIFLSGIFLPFGSLKNDDDASVLFACILQPDIEKSWPMKRKKCCVKSSQTKLASQHRQQPQKQCFFSGFMSLQLHFVVACRS